MRWGMVAPTIALKSLKSRFPTKTRGNWKEVIGAGDGPRQGRRCVWDETEVSAHLNLMSWNIMHEVKKAWYTGRQRVKLAGRLFKQLANHIGITMDDTYCFVDPLLLQGCAGERCYHFATDSVEHCVMLGKELRYQNTTNRHWDGRFGGSFTECPHQISGVFP